jgi:uncharacterized protein (DUF342 family)
VKGNVGPSTGNIDESGDLRVEGGVCDLFEVRATGSATIAGVVGAASVRVGGDLAVAGGIAGKGVALCLAGGSIAARHISSAVVEAYGSIRAAAIFESTIVCGADLLVESGAFAASKAVVAGNVSCKVLGLESGAATTLEVGVSEFVRRDAASTVPGIEKLNKKLTQLRATAQPLLRNAKTLTAREKEQATEMLFEADEVQQKSEHLLDNLKQTMKSCPAAPDPRVRVAEKIFPGVTIRFPRCEATIHSPIDGRVELAMHRVGVNYQVIAIDPQSGSSIPLPSRPTEDPVMSSLHRLLNEKSP